MIDRAFDPVYNQRLFGHEDIEKFLSQYYCSGRMHHALLFEGEQGIGKATLGFRYAGHVLQNPDFSKAPVRMCNPDPCSPFVKQMASHALHDFLYLSYSLNPKTGKWRTVITVDEIRRIRYFLSLTANTGYWRVIMIDPVDGMNRNAANALLKSLEEPPQKVLFILISHASPTILSTIRSRCLSIKFNSLSENNLYKALEQLKIMGWDSKRDFVKIAAYGSVARAIKILHYDCDKIISSYIDLIHIPRQEYALQKMQQIADELLSQDQKIAFDFLIEFILKEICKSAKAAALSGQLEEADQIAQIYFSLVKRVHAFSMYNLDRRQMIFHLLSKARECNDLYFRDFYAI
ncbi:DNA polymerase III subunit delta' [Candidatus Liberibacter asiaticus]|uniref:DNA polymerase III subunit delta n=2 Tax=Liberibacter asiaticus TaxID=34021 RepID=C6XHE7_LIBAP|nr:DNA polymerase III subunit delta' [Candidatus Liberibacter asiaticus]ACT56690.1 DNA polymerase III subunit delta' [Candidatus Liberibacter asiaticus str. psy62]AGH16457.1 DNA polymerase III subunit delta' [Candidatus Liberibacter asiaticus str. gxpsy]ASK52333.1 DNA polymerase III subunit delta' [Candidatus Liberibacter asiaticus]AWL13656.1 DNA polymerase III subunit delta' [Candidatus Liberibacter asiaticus]KAE9510571.1 DNA polymerase III subunit tau [Candidatus Liberibacter asiaticus]